MRRGEERGAAAVELAVLLPLAVLLLTAGEWLTELLAIRLKAREAARLLAWDRRGPEEAVAAVQRAYGDLDSGRDADAPSGLFSRAGPLRTSVASEPLSWDAPRGALRPDAGGRAAALAARARTAPLRIAAAAGLQAPRVVRAQARTSVRMPRLGLELWGPTGRQGLPAHLEIEETVAVVTGDGASQDGADSRVVGGRTGVGPEGGRTELWRRVDRLKFLTDRQALAPEVGLAATVGGLVGAGRPQLDGTFVVDHALRPREGRRCEAIPGYPREALSALRDFGEGVDPGSPRCFGTQPLRDTQRYDASLQLESLRQRGPHFLGCGEAEADDPSRVTDADLSDANTLKRSCGGGR